MQQPMHSTSSSSGLITYVAHDVLGSISILLDDWQLSDRFRHPRRYDAEFSFTPKVITRIQVVIQDNRDTPSPFRNDPEGIVQILVRKSAIDALCGSEVSQVARNLRELGTKENAKV